MGSLLSVRGLTIRVTGRRGDVPIVEDLGFDLLPGEAVGLVGPSGAGKSSIALALLGCLPPPARVAAGSALFEGHDLFALPGSADAHWRKIRGRRIGVLFQEPASALDPLMTIGAQIAEVIRAHHSRSAKQARGEAGEWLRRMGLDGRIARSRAHEISGGQRQRAALAVALAGGPSLLIADEPTTALDLEAQRQVLDLLAGLRVELGLTLLLIGHDAAVLRYACSRTIRLPVGARA